MQRSTERILTTHAGSLIRDPALAELLMDREQGRAVDGEALDTAIAADMDRLIARQLESGVDIGNDGEVPRIGFSTYVEDRMSGFGGESHRNDIIDFLRFPQYRALYLHRYHATTTKNAKKWNAPQAVADLHYDDDMREVTAECDAFAAALARQQAKFAETFMTAVSPGNMTCTLLNAHYPSEQDYLTAAARELKKEYDFIHARGFVLQIDAPDLALERQLYFQNRTHADFIEGVARHVAAINQAVADIPPERVRLHVCWGNYEGPHSGDVPLDQHEYRAFTILPLLYEARVGALCIGAGQPASSARVPGVHALPAARVHASDELAHQPGCGMKQVSLVHVLGPEARSPPRSNYLELDREVVADRICQVVEAVGDSEPGHRRDGLWLLDLRRLIHRRRS